MLLFFSQEKSFQLKIEMGDPNYLPGLVRSFELLATEHDDGEDNVEPLATLPQPSIANVIFFLFFVIPILLLL